MKGITILFYLMGNFFSLIWGNIVYANELSKSDQSILIIKSKESPFYNQTIHSITDSLTKGYTYSIKNLASQLSIKTSTIIVTLGQNAALYARKNFPNNYKIFTFLNLAQSSKLKLETNETHLLIELKTTDYLNFSNTLFPNKKIGVLYQKHINNEQELTDDNLYLVQISKQNHIISATRDIIKSVDILMALPNKNIYNRHSLKGIILSTYQNRIPLISYSSAHVKVGAVAAIYASPANIGQQSIDIIQALQSNHNFEPKRYFSEYFSIKINHRVAQSLAIKLSSRELLIKKIKAKRAINE